jgi:hypothetical protein
MAMPTRIPFVGLSFGLVLLVTTIATACPLCGSPQKTLSEDFASADVVVLARVHLKKLCEQDLKTVQQVERFWLVK